MRHVVILLFCFGSTFLFSFSAIAQANEGEIENQQIIVEKNKKIELPEAQRGFEKIVIEKKTVDVSKQNYSYNDYHLPLPLMDAKLKILTVKEEPLPKLYANYIKAGIGNYATSYLEAFLYNKRSEKLAYGLNLRHFASARGPLKRSGLSDNHILLYGKYLLSKASIDSDLGYFRTARHFYGYNQDLEFKKDTLKQRFNNIVWNIGIKSNDSSASFKYQGNIEISNLNDAYKAKETEALIRYKTLMKLDENSYMGVRGLISISSRSDSTKYVRNLVSLQPYYQRTLDKLILTGGLNFGFENDTLFSKKNFHLYPALKGEYKIIENIIHVFGGLDGNMERNTLRSTLKENPWLTNRVALAHSNKLVELFIGTKGTLLKKVTYQLQGSYLSYKNLPFMVNNGQDSLRFALVYDSNNVKITRLKAEASYSLDTKMLAGVSFTYNGYNMGTLKQAWHMPKMQANYYLTYFLKDKMVFHLSSYMFAGIKAVDPSGKEIVLPTILDLNVKVDYLFSRNFSAFLELNNLLANKYERYLYYKQKGINLLLGATCSF